MEEERGLSQYSFDYCFPGDEFGFKLTVLVGCERGTGMKMATVVPTKGSSGKYAADKAVEFIGENGDMDQDIIVKTDQEPSIEFYMIESRGEKSGRTIIEEAPKSSSGSNGACERAVQTIEGQMRAMKVALEDRWGLHIDPAHPVVTYMADYCAYLLNRLEVGVDGKTGYERVKGKKANVLGIEFGEKLLWKVRRKNKMAKLDPRWEEGVFVGVRRRSGEVCHRSSRKAVCC